MKSIILICRDCGEKFEFSAGEQRYYQKHNLSFPKRCKECRDKNNNRKIMPGLKKSSILDNARIYGMPVPVDQGRLEVTNQYEIQIISSEKIRYFSVNENGSPEITEDSSRIIQLPWVYAEKIKAKLEKIYKGHPEIIIKAVPHSFWTPVDPEQ